MLAAARQASLRQTGSLLAMWSLGRSSTAPLARIVPPTSSVDVSRCIGALASAFAQVPCTNSFSAESRQSVREYVDATVRASILRPGGALVEAGDTSAVALWELPHTRDQAVLPVTSVRSIEPEIPHIPAIKKEWKEAVRRAKEKYIGLDGPLPQGRVRPHYHLDFLARNPHIPKVEGAVSAVVLPFLDMAKQDKLSVWLEATSLDVVPLYKSFGFQVVEVIKVGMGKFDGNGQAKKGGEGVEAWLMLINNGGSDGPFSTSLQ